MSNICFSFFFLENLKSVKDLVKNDGKRKVIDIDETDLSDDMDLSDDNEEIEEQKTSSSRNTTKHPSSTSSFNASSNSSQTLKSSSLEDLQSHLDTLLGLRESIKTLVVENPSDDNVSKLTTINSKIKSVQGILEKKGKKDGKKKKFPRKPISKPEPPCKRTEEDLERMFFSSFLFFWFRNFFK